MKAPKKFERHPWREWFASSPVRLQRGKDYSCRTDSMAQAARFAAKRLGVKVHIEIADSGRSLTLTTEAE